MRNKFFKKIITITLIISFIIPYLSLYPIQTKAALLTTDVGNIVQSTISAVNSTATSLSTYSVQFKEYVLDPLASGMAKMIIRSITSSVVNWINSGFEGSPSFVQNPGAFFLDMADQITGDFLSKVGGPLVNLCSPFSIDIRIALAFKYHPNIQKRYTCTLGTIIKNTTNAVQNASINGFNAGDFRQGGWPAFVSLTTEPQNNQYGAYLTAESEMSWRIANAQAQQKDELSQGKGFLSWKSCKNVPLDQNFKSNVGVVSDEDPNDPRIAAYYEGNNSYKDCKIQTPGSVISASLENSIGGPLRELELADEINEIVNALFAQLVTQVLQTGLSGVSSKDATGKSYLDQTVADINTENNPQVQKTRSDLLANIDAYLQDTLTVKKYRDDALKIMLDIKGNYDAAKLCYISKTNLTPGQTSDAQSRIKIIDQTINSTIAPSTLDLLTQAQRADARLATLNKIKSDATTAKTLNDLIKPSQDFSELVLSRNLAGAKEIQDAKEALSIAEANSVNMKQDALRELQKCQLYPNAVN